MVTCHLRLQYIFLSTLSLRRATIARLPLPIRKRDFYPRSPCGERPHCPASWFDLWGWKISIHALLAESDVEKVPADVFYQAFLSTLSLRRATTLPQKAVTTRGFLSTLSLRRATHGFLRGLPKEHLFLSTLSLRRATDANLGRHRSDNDFYPRSPCGERHLFSTLVASITTFLSTLSLRRATVRMRVKGQIVQISIHALLAESD